MNVLSSPLVEFTCSCFSAINDNVCHLLLANLDKYLFSGLKYYIRAYVHMCYVNINFNKNLVHFILPIQN